MMELLVFNGKKMFLLFCVLFIAGSLVQGFPMKKENYQRIRCIPEDNDIACAQETASFDQDSNIIDRSPISKKIQTHIASIPLSAEDNGSGDGFSSGKIPGLQVKVTHFLMR